MNARISVYNDLKVNCVGGKQEINTNLENRKYTFNYLYKQLLKL